MAEIKQTLRASRMLNKAYECCKDYRHEFVMPEHLLLALTDEFNFNKALGIFYSPYQLEERLREYLESIEVLPEGTEYIPDASAQMSRVIEMAVQSVVSSSAEELDIPHLTRGILALEDSWAAYLLKDCLYGKEANFMSQLIGFCEFEDELGNLEEEGETQEKAAWKQLVTCMNDLYQKHNPLIGREQELQRTIQVLCRRDKNNPLHVGEPGVGKTALVWGLARMIEEGRVPERLKGSRIYQLDMGTLLAGTQYRGDFENRIKMIMDGVQAESSNNIVYIDEIHTLVGAGATGEGAMDASNMLKPYLESGNIRFIGSTTYEEYNRHFARSKGMIRRFQQIDIAEPSIEETKHILRQLQPRYEEFHKVKYDDEAIDFAVEASAKHVNDRFLPDKAIDLIDEAGASAEVRGQTEEVRVSKADIADVLAKTCKVDALAVAEDEDYQQLETLAPRMLSQIYGQDEAIRQVVEAVQMSRAGLLDDNKPLASLLFVGPTGVGKTEVAKVLAKELGIELIRFDMSEYTEKHTVAKLIGSPAGYVGYEDGGLLTDAIRKTPNAVLLLDEIEKAHQDIYNILLQVMDYARLTDNKGRKADFRNVVLIMTSNAGAQFASQSIGFNSSVSRGEAMMKQVKKTFKPEFLNRLSGAVVFHDMDREMATLILKKKLRELEAKLDAKQVKMTLTEEAFDHLLKEGFTPEYGAREMDRVIAQQLKPLLMREILFGSLKQGGDVTVGLNNGILLITHNL
ncbi:MAG: ATP-dependent Clp protease ATP-binding subunit ClpA [Bacteroidaceae bacterium]|nr:ATP-dependent Clp protease ATP-binding subunit ClpA [Bacteroidaceae bacterium]